MWVVLFLLLSSVYDVNCICESWTTNADLLDDGCVHYIRQMSANDTLFWFGNDGSTTEGEIAAYSNYTTLGSRLFVIPDFDPDYDLADLSRPLQVTYEWGRGMVWGCNSSEEVGGGRVEVVVGMGAVGGLSVRNPPFIYPFGCSLDNLCTVIFYDAGNAVLHNVWPNWPLERNISDYRPPAHSTLQPNPYVFLVFQQRNYIQLFSDNWRFFPFTFKLTEFIFQYRLIGHKYLLLMVERDNSTHRTEGECGEVFLHWFLYNSPFSDVAYGTEIFPYLGMSPETDRVNEQFYFLLFRQNREMKEVSQWLNWNCGRELYTNRCKFSLKSFVEWNDLSLVGLSRFQIRDPHAQPYIKSLLSLDDYEAVCPATCSAITRFCFGRHFNLLFMNLLTLSFLRITNVAFQNPS